MLALHRTEVIQWKTQDLRPLNRHARRWKIECIGRMQTAKDFRLQPARMRRPMAPDDVITKARELPSGAVFHRCALQVNPHHYDSTYRGHAPSGDAVDHAGAIVQKASDLGVSVLAITDHNHVGGVAAFRAAAEGRGIRIFPGFELSSSEGIHVLCIYAPDTADDLLARYQPVGLGRGKRARKRLGTCVNDALCLCAERAASTETGTVSWPSVADGAWRPF